jgi:hypothetical protein
MPQGGAARKIQPSASDNNRSSSNAAKRASYEPKKPANDQQAERREYLESHRGQILPDNDQRSETNPHKILLKNFPKLLSRAVKNELKNNKKGRSREKLTGAGSASPTGKKSKKSQSRSVGPQAATRPVNPMQMASRLQADQQQSRLDNAPGTGQTREQMLAGTGSGENPILPGQFDPLQGQSSFGRQAQAPGSMSEPAESAAAERGGGPVMSDLERQRAMQLNQAQMTSSAGATGVVGAGQTGTEAPSQEGSGFSQHQTAGTIQESDQTTQETQQTTDQAQGNQTQPGKTGSDIQTAQNIAAAMHMEKTAKALAVAQSVKGNVEAARKVAKTAQTFWNIIKAGELAAGVTVISLIILIITANLQMINKYTFKARLIPPTFLVEDFAIICFNCALCGATCISLTAMPFIMIPVIGGLVIIGGILGLDFLDIIKFGIFE